MSKKKNSHHVEVSIALIGLIGALGAAVISNWDKVFAGRREHVGQRPPTEPAPEERADHSVFQVKIYYFPSRKADAISLRSALERSGYLVNVTPAADDPTLTDKDGARGSYIFFNESEYRSMLKVRQLIESHFGEPIDVFKSKQGEGPNSMDFVLTNKRRDTASAAPNG